MKLRTTLPIIAAAAIIASCSHTGDTPSTDITFETITGTYAYRLAGSARDYMRDSDIICYDSASVLLPLTLPGCDVTSLRDSIVSAAFDTVAEPAAAMRAYFASQGAESGYPTDTTTYATEANADGLLLVDGAVTYLTPAWMTYCVTTGISMPGAAHGITTRRYINYSIADGRQITLRSIFTPAGIERLPGLIASQARRMKAILGPTTIDALPAADNFYLSADGTIVFAYQPYEVASYAQGEIRVPFYPYQLSDLLNDTGLRIFGLNR